MLISTLSHSPPLQVLDGGGRDVDYTIYKPNGKLIRQGRRNMEAYFEQNAADDGPWRVGLWEGEMAAEKSDSLYPSVSKFCFSNSFSMLQSKKIFFALTMLT